MTDGIMVPASLSKLNAWGVADYYIASNIVDSVQRSRRTLVVLTRALLASHWCHYELQMALMEQAETGRDVLLFLLYEHVPSQEMPREVLFNSGV